ncbi:MAG: 50S ribosomal protein L22 [Spirochaetes bacterium]|nr:50S ribosomal protein L22 [Spirochaetota bacterium]
MDYKVKVQHIRIARSKIARLVPFIKGIYVQRALANLHALPQKSSQVLQKAIRSGMANALFKNRNINADTLWVREARVDMGTRLQRSVPMPRGSAGKLQLMYSHLSLTLTDDAPPAKIRHKKGVGIITAQPAQKAAEPAVAAAPAKKE